MQQDWVQLDWSKSILLVLFLEWRKVGFLRMLRDAKTEIGQIAFRKTISSVQLKIAQMKDQIKYQY